MLQQKSKSLQPQTNFFIATIVTCQNEWTNEINIEYTHFLQFIFRKQQSKTAGLFYSHSYYIHCLVFSQCSDSFLELSL